MMDLNPLAEGCKLTAIVVAGLGTGIWLIRRLQKPVLDLIWCIFIGIVLAFTIGAWIWSIIVGGSL